MEDDQELTGKTVLRLFPLSGVVFFPHSVLPLHIFEPRYRQMTEDALASDNLVAIVNVSSPSDGQGKGPPKLEEYGCVGRILRFERLPDGRFNFLLLGLKRVRLLRELSSGKLYRIAEVEVVEEVLDDERHDSEALRSELVDLFRRYLEDCGGIDPDLDEVVSSGLPLGTLADILAHALQLPIEMKQRLLGDPDVIARVKAIGTWLAQIVSPPPNRTVDRPGFPPPFSVN
jgi:Lon protease-like protein